MNKCEADLVFIQRNSSMCFEPDNKIINANSVNVLCILAIGESSGNFTTSHDKERYESKYWPKRRDSRTYDGKKKNLIPSCFP